MRPVNRSGRAHTARLQTDNTGMPRTTMLISGVLTRPTHGRIQLTPRMISPAASGRLLARPKPPRRRLGLHPGARPRPSQVRFVHAYEACQVFRLGPTCASEQGDVCVPSIEGQLAERGGLIRSGE